MTNKTIRIGLLSTLVLGLGFLAAAIEPPTTSIANGVIRAKLNLPDVDNGYYRGVRFDWAGSIASLESGGHTYFGQWFPKWDPHVHDSITGPVEDYAPLNYTEAKPGETFVKIGIGVLKKTDDTPYRFSAPYELLDTGEWNVRTGADFVEFHHEVADPKSGYAYVYTKTVRLTPGKSQMTITHDLKNTGRKAISTNVYNHGFFMLDSQTTGPDFTVTFPFEIKASRDMNGLAETRGNQIVYLKQLQDAAPGGAAANNASPGGAATPAPAPAATAAAAPGGGQGRGAGGGSGRGGGGRQTASTPVEGFSSDPKDFDVRLENHKTGAGVRITADRPLWRINFWSIRTTVCPEVYVEVKADAGQETIWRLTYDFYSLPASAAR